MLTNKLSQEELQVNEEFGYDFITDNIIQSELSDRLKVIQLYKIRNSQCIYQG
jgi:hypothetical protein